jgi:enoyl-CoA hydratase/carnithine racemase
MSDVLLVEDPAPHVRQIKLNRPEQLNAMTAELCSALHLELERAGADRSCRVIVLTGAGRGFCAGLDLRGYGQAPPEAVSAFLEKRAPTFAD